MEESGCKAYDELPLFLNAETVSKLPGVSPSSCYELLCEKGFLSLRIGSRIVVPTWVEAHVGQ